MDRGSLELFDIVIDRQDWLLAAGMIVAGLTVLVAWSYWMRGSGSGLRACAMGLKITAAVLLGFCLIEPMRRVERPRPGANAVAIVVDNSRSMQTANPGARAPRHERLRPLMPSNAGWQSRLAQDFDVRRYAFDDRLRAVEDLSQLDFSGNNSSMAGAIRTLMERFAKRPMAGVLLFTDGLATDDLAGLIAEQRLGFPIFPVASSTEAAVQDVRIRDAAVQVASFELAPVGIDAWIEAIGLEGEQIVVRLMSETGETFEKQTLKCTSEEWDERVRFTYRPREPGFQVVQIRAALLREDRDEGPLQTQREVTLANNLRLLAVDRRRGPYRVLYVAGRPNWEFKFLRRALEEDLELDMSALIRIAKEEPKFSFRDRGVQSANPLRAGFDDNDDTTERYDEPVLLRLGADAEQLRAGFPGDEEELFGYHAIILDDVEADFFTPQQMLLMRQFVAQRGGGLMMLGGVDSFQAGRYDGTPLEDVLPVYLRPTRMEKSKPVRYRLTREGKLEPWLRLRAKESEEEIRMQHMPDFLTWNATSEIKPGARALASLETPVGPRPGLVVHRFGKGRGVALMVGDLWRWSMRRPDPQTDDLAQTWRQIVRWLTTDVPRRVEVDIERPSDPLGPFRLEITVHDPTFQPMDNAKVEVTVTQPDGSRIAASATPHANQLGVYTLDYWCRRDGGYRCRVQVTMPDGQALDPVDSGWTAQPSAREFARVVPDLEQLNRLAAVSGGEVISPEQLDRFVAQLPTRKVPVTESRVEPLWHRPWLILLALGCLCAEWGLRRWRGLP